MIFPVTIPNYAKIVAVLATVGKRLGFLAHKLQSCCSLIIFNCIKLFICTLTIHSLVVM